MSWRKVEHRDREYPTVHRATYVPPPEEPHRRARVKKVKASKPKPARAIAQI